MVRPAIEAESGRSGCAACTPIRERSKRMNGKRPKERDRPRAARDRVSGAEAERLCSKTGNSLSGVGSGTQPVSEAESAHRIWRARRARHWCSEVEGEIPVPKHARWSSRRFACPRSSVITPPCGSPPADRESRVRGEEIRKRAGRSSPPVKGTGAAAGAGFVAGIGFPPSSPPNGFDVHPYGPGTGGGTVDWPEKSEGRRRKPL